MTPTEADEKDDTLDEALPLNGAHHRFATPIQRLLNEVHALGEVVRRLAAFVHKLQLPSQRNATATVVALAAIAVLLGWIGTELHMLRVR